MKNIKLLLATRGLVSRSSLKSLIKRLNVLDHPECGDQGGVLGRSSHRMQLPIICSSPGPESLQSDALHSATTNIGIGHLSSDSVWSNKTKSNNISCLNQTVFSCE